MKYIIKGSGLVVTDEIRAFVAKRLVRTEELLRDDETAYADVELEAGVGEHRKQYRAGYTLSCASHVHRAQAYGDTLNAVIDRATSELTREVERSKRRHTRLVRRGAARIKEFIRGFRNRL